MIFQSAIASRRKSVASAMSCLGYPVLFRLVSLMIFCAIYPAARAQAEGNAKGFLQSYDSASPTTQESLRAIIKLVEDGISWADADLKSRHQPMLYCPPAKLALTGEQLVDMLHREVKENPIDADFPFGLGLLNSLEKVFPCTP
jgi:hypothetical protein